MLANILAVVVLAFGACVDVLNCGCVIANIRFKRQGIKRHVSTQPLLAQIFAYIGALLSSRTLTPLLPGWIFWLVALSDVALLSILYYPIFLIRRKFRA
jgi:hypothetical protein